MNSDSYITKFNLSFINILSYIINHYDSINTTVFYYHELKPKFILSLFDTYDIKHFTNLCLRTYFDETDLKTNMQKYNLGHLYNVNIIINNPTFISNITLYQ